MGKIRHDPETFYEVICSACDFQRLDILRESDAEKIAFEHQHTVAMREVTTWVWGPK